MGFDHKAAVSSSELAGVLGLTSARVGQLAKDGIITTVSRGKYALSDAVQSYIDYRVREKAMTKAENDKQDAEVSIKKAKAIVSVLEAKELQGKMHRSEDVANMTEDLIYTIRGMLLALPGRLAIDAANLTDPIEVSELIRNEVYALMGELAKYKYDSAKYAERVRTRKNWERPGNEADSDD